MALRHIVTVGDSVLTKVSRPVTQFDSRLHLLLDDMVETLLDAGGVGLAAPQVGVLRRVVVVDTGEDGILELINPEIIDQSGSQTGLEGCLSVPGKYGIVTRPNVVTVRAQDRDGNWFEVEGEALIARCFCHELAHLDGQLYTEVAERMLPRGAPGAHRGRGGGRLRLVFMGTPEIAKTCLQAIYAAGHEIVGVYTKQDTPKNRGMKLTMSPVKEFALAHDLPVFQPKTFKDEAVLSELRALKPALLVVVAYGKILPQAVLDIPEKGAINMHASILPELRGAGPVQWSTTASSRTTPS